MSALLLASCGGGGGSSNLAVGGPIVVEPNGATIYAGVKTTFTVTGGRPPYQIISSEPALLPVPATLDGHSFDVVPNNPSVIDTGLPDDALPIRTVNVTARSLTDGTSATAIVKVARNFLTGYGIAFGVTTCTSVPAPCAGGETQILFDSTFVGNLQPNRTYRVERVRGPFQFIDPLNSNNQSDSILVTSDSNGRFTAVIRVASGAPTQIGIIRVTEVSSGSTAQFSFAINSNAPSGLTLIPETVTLTGPDDKTCGSGRFDVLVFDGQKPYTAICSNPQILPVNSPSDAQPGRLTFVVGQSSICLTDEKCVIQDAANQRVILSVNTVKGTAATPPPAMTASPTSLTLGCGQSGVVTVVGGNGPPYSAFSSHSRVTATASGNTVTITRLTADGAPAGTFPASATVSITDGATIVPVTVTVPTGGC